MANEIMYLAFKERIFTFMANNKKCTQIGVIKSFASGCKLISQILVRCVLRCALRDMFQFQLKCDIYANLIKKELGMMDYNMKK